MLSLGIIQLVLILPIYLFLIFFQNDLFLIFLFLYSFFLSFNVVKNKNSSLLFNDSCVIFLIFLFLYGIFNPLVELVIFGELSKVTYLATLIYASTIPAFVLGVILVKSNDHDINYLSIFYKKIKNNKYNFFLLFLLIALIFYVSYDFYSQGILFNPSVALKISRLELFSEINQLKILIGLLISSIFLYFIYYFPTFSMQFKLIIVFIFCYFVLMELSVGNRRDFVPMIIGIFWTLVNYKKFIFNFSRFIFMILGLFSFLFLGSIRSTASIDQSFNFSNLALLTLSNNEFIYPFYTLVHYLSKFLNGSIDFLYGSSIFFNPFLYFIPRTIFPDKPISLAVQFINEINSSMGYAFSPVTELFLNFGIIGPFFGFLFIGYFISIIQSFKDQRINFVFFTMIPDFCRGELGTFFYQFFFVSLFIIVIPNLFFNLKKYNLS